MPQDAQGRYYPAEEPLADATVASAARTATGSGSSFDTRNLDSLTATLTVSAVAGTSPTLDVRLETTADGTNYYTVSSFPQQTAAGTVARVFDGLGSSCRWAWTIAGTAPSFTFGIDVTATRD